ELAAALATRDRLLAEHPGLAQSALWGKSGNGCWILVRLPDYPNDAAHRALVGKALDLLAARYSDDAVKIDTATRNPSRVMCLPGTLKCKGDSIPDRPHRPATLDGGADGPGPFDLEEWVALFGEVVAAEAAAGREGGPPAGQGGGGEGGGPAAAVPHAT